MNKLHNRSDNSLGNPYDFMELNWISRSPELILRLKVFSERSGLRYVTK